MRRRYLVFALGALAVGATLPTLVSAATTAYTSPSLRVTQAGARTSITAAVAPADDGTAQVSIYVPASAAISTTAVPGAVVGTVQATIAAHMLGGALIPLSGQIVVVQPAPSPPPPRLACIGTATPLTVWVMSLSAAGQTLEVPMYVVPTSGAETALGAARIVACFTAHDLPGTPPPCAPVLCAQFLSATLVFDAVFTPAPGTWVSTWTPYQRGNGQVNPAGTVASPSTIAPGSVALAARRTGARITVTGTVTQAGRPVAGASVRLVRGRVSGRLTGFKTVRTNAQGRFTTVSPRAAGAFFRGSTAVPARTSAAACASLAGRLPVPCVNGTLSGFTATSPVVRAR